MRLRLHPRPAPPRHRGFASVIVLGMLLVMVLLVMANGRVVSALRQELRALDQRQLQKYGNAAATNLPPVSLPARPPQGSGES